MHRREFMPLMAGLGLFPAARAAEPPPPASMPFDTATVRRVAKDLAAQAYVAPEISLPGPLNDLDYSAYQKLRFDKSRALWLDHGKFTVEFFHRGYLFRNRVDMLEVSGGVARPFKYTANLFDLSAVPGAQTDGDIGFAGFRVHYPLNRPDYKDEVCAFVGASYFRGVARGQGYGLSARGLAIRTADTSGEEFPLFKRFWLERPADDSDVLVIHALLDSPSVAGAYRFTVRPGQETTMDTEMALYPRVDLPQAGLAPMTSMFFFDANNRTGFDDYRAAVHDSQGLALLTGKGERVWRTLDNPRALQVSAFLDASPRGFGLAQRDRDFHRYQDLEAVYEKRPTLWVEPLGDWGQGFVTLVEIPSDREVNDNIVAFWRPRDKLAAHGEYIMSYRLHWCWEHPEDATLAKVLQVRCGLTFDHKNRQFVIDFTGGSLKDRNVEAPPDIEVAADKGKIQNQTLQKIPGDSTWRLSFQLTTGGEKLIELRARLCDGAKPLSETWLYRWTA